MPTPEHTLARAEAPQTLAAQAIASDLAPDVAEQVFAHGNIGALSPQQKLAYYSAYCNALGLNPLTRPFQYLQLSGKLTLYATRDCADQLRKIHGVSIQIIDRQIVDGLYIVHVRATTQDGRTDEATGVLPLGNLQGENRANALMKAETKAKRRVTLSICGLGVNDETEVETIPGGSVIAPDAAHASVPSERPAKRMSEEAAWLTSIGASKEQKDSIKAVADRANLAPHYVISWAKQQGLDDPADVVQAIEENWPSEPVQGLPVDDEPAGEAEEFNPFEAIAEQTAKPRKSSAARAIAQEG